MSDLVPISITHQFDGDPAAVDAVDASQLDTQLGNLAAAQNDTKAALDIITDGANRLAAATVGLAQLKPEVVVAMDQASQALLGKTILRAVKVVADTNQTLSGYPTIDGYTLIGSERVLLTAQTTASENGIYTIPLISGAWTKDTSFDPIAVVAVDSGTFWAASIWVEQADGTTWIRATASYIVNLAAHIAATGTAVHGLGDSSTKDVGTTAGTVCAGDDSRLSDDRDPTAHQSSHLSGGSDALSGNLAAVAKLNILASGAVVGSRRGLNFIPGTGVTLTVADASSYERVNVTIAAQTVNTPYDRISALASAVVPLITDTTLNNSAFGKMHVFTCPLAGSALVWNGTTAQLPSATSNAGKFIAFKNSPLSPNYTLALIHPTGGAKINNTTFDYRLDTGMAVALYCDGTNYWVVDEYADVPLVGYSLAGTGVITGVATAPTVGTTTNTNIYLHRKGRDIHFRANYQQTGVGSAGSGAYLINLPFTIDLNKLLQDQSGTPVGIGTFGSALLNITGSPESARCIMYTEASFRVWASGGVWGSGHGPLSTASIVCSIDCVMPLVNVP